MKVFNFVLVLLTLMSPLVFAKKLFFDSPARAVWIEENKLKLTLPNNLNVNGVSIYYLWNDTSKIKIPLQVSNAYDRKVELEVKTLSTSDLQNLITGALSLVATSGTGEIVDETSIQLAGLLDSRFYYSGNDLGMNFVSTVSGTGKFDFKLWSPTASEVQLYLYKESDDQVPTTILNLTKDLSGTWKTSLDYSFNKYFYLYKVTAYSPSTKSIETNLVTDPYSRSLSINSQKSQILNVYNSEFMPLGWNGLVISSDEKKIIYETHLRDLTANDHGLSVDERGTFLGLTRDTSNAKQHLKALADSGLTYIHFLPLSDFASVNEDRKNWETLDLDQAFPSASDRPQINLNRTRHIDSYNWGYDPYHYFVPEGSYSKSPDGFARIKELRSMVQSLSQIGLRTIVDVVFNHTYSSGSDTFSVLNKIVPMYYYRLNEFGNISNSSCCSDTASENKMMEKLMIDSVVYWARTYKISGFRFDLMSFHTRSNILKVKEALNKLTVAKDGINGSEIYLYGEGWSFGSLVEKNSSIAFTQLNSYGAGVGFFNDRFRDAVRGGTTDSSEKSDQGFATGLYSDFNKEIANRNTPTDLNEQKNKLMFLGDVVKIGMAGNLRDYLFKNFTGGTTLAKDFYFKGMPTGYAATTDETINYVSAHDGYCLWDAISAKTPFFTHGRFPETASTFEKQRIQQLALGLTLFSQGIPFIEGGSEILRSKSGDVDSYDSGDWYNHLNWDYSDNNWGKGLPPSFKNYNDWSFWSPRLNDNTMKPNTNDITNNLNVFRAFLKIRNSSSLFNLKSLNEINSSLKFFDNEISPNPGLIALNLKGPNEEMVILFNSNKNPIVFKHPNFLKPWKLHPHLTFEIDPVLKDVSFFNDQIIIPGRTIVVLVPKGNIN